MEPWVLTSRSTKTRAVGAVTRVFRPSPTPSPCACLTGASEAHNAMHSRYYSRVGHPEQVLLYLLSFPVISDLVVP